MRTVLNIFCIVSHVTRSFRYFELAGFHFGFAILPKNSTKFDFDSILVNAESKAELGEISLLIDYCVFDLHKKQAKEVFTMWKVE